MTIHDPLTLVSLNLDGNLHAACNALNAAGLAQYLVTMQYSGSDYTVAVLRMPLSEKLNFQSMGVL